MQWPEWYDNTAEEAKQKYSGMNEMIRQYMTELFRIQI